MRSVKSFFRGSVFAAACLGTAAAASASVTFSDSSPGTNAANWATVTSGAGGLYVLGSGNSYQQYDSGSLRITGFPWSHTAGVYWGLGSQYTPASIDPGSQGAIATLDMSVSAQRGSTDGVNVAFLLMQNGKYYRSNFFNIAGGSAPDPVHVFASTGLTGASFGQFIAAQYGYTDPNSISGADDGAADFSKNPDFSASGAPITLGYLADFNTSLGDPNGGGVAYVMTSAWSATANFASVPEPASLASIALVGLLALRRRHAI